MENMNNKSRGGLGPLEMLEASTLQDVAPAVRNLANNLFGQLFGCGAFVPEKTRRRKAKGRGLRRRRLV